MDERVALAREGRLPGETPDNAGRMPALPGEMWKRCFDSVTLRLSGQDFVMI